MAKATKTATQELTNFAVRRSLNPTPARMFSVLPDCSQEPVRVQRTTVLGTQGQYGLKVKEGKSAVATNNIQSVDVAFLNPDASELRVQFSLKVQRQSGADGANIEMCNLAEVEKRIREMNDAYAKAGGFRHLAGLYEDRIASGAWLWRNRFGSNLEVGVDATVDGAPAGRFLFVNGEENVAGGLAGIIEKGLIGEGVVSLDVEADIEIGKGQEVYPSQEMASNTDVSRIYYADEAGNAMMHSQKIGNALRTIDIWHPAFDLVGALPVEPYGSSIKKQDAYRFESRSFYSILAQVVAGQGDILRVLEAKSASDLDSIEDVHYFFAMLIRGGVFGMKS